MQGEVCPEVLKCCFFAAILINKLIGDMNFKIKIYFSGNIFKWLLKKIFTRRD